MVSEHVHINSRNGISTYTPYYAHDWLSLCLIQVCYNLLLHFRVLTGLALRLTAFEVPPPIIYDLREALPYENACADAKYRTSLLGWSKLATLATDYGA